MRMRSFILCTILAGVILVLAPQMALTQDEMPTCEPLVEQAFTQLEENCAGLDASSACYASSSATVTGGADGTFNQPGDRTSLSEIESIQTGALNPEQEQWGIAVMNVQANVPTALGNEGVKFLLLGDVEVENAVAPENVMQPGEPMTVTTLVGSNLRSGPSTNATVLNSVPAGTELQADGLNRDGQWLRVFHDGAMAWVSRSVVGSSDPLETLPVWGGDSRTLMQDFYFSTGSGLADCTGALPALLIIQGPQGVPVSLTINGVDMRLDSTIALWVQDGEMHLMVLQGAAQVGTLSIPQGFTAKAPLSEDGHSVTGAWENLRAMSPGERTVLTPLQNLPADSLNNQIEIPTEQDIQATLAALNASSVGEARTGPASGRADCSRFRVTSPLDGLSIGTTTFYWDAALGADNYQINIFDASGSQVGTFQTNSANTALSVDTSGGSIGGGFNFSWEVQALVNNQVACTTSRVTVLREAGTTRVERGGGGNDNPGSGGGWSP